MNEETYRRERLKEVVPENLFETPSQKTLTVSDLVAYLTGVPLTARVHIVFEEICSDEENVDDEVDVPAGEVHWEPEENVLYIREVK